MNQDRLQRISRPGEIHYKWRNLSCKIKEYDLLTVAKGETNEHRTTHFVYQ